MSKAAKVLAQAKNVGIQTSEAITLPANLKVPFVKKDNNPDALKGKSKPFAISKAADVHNTIADPDSKGVILYVDGTPAVSFSIISNRDRMLRIGPQYFLDGAIDLKALPDAVVQSLKDSKKLSDRIDDLAGGSKIVGLTDGAQREIVKILMKADVKLTGVVLL